ncbi:MAG: hypothetical protein KAH57_05660 [Thermoplasmata archaeon]|nr:hypothetical protein [Thermoplasmata archaeon]
MTDITQDHLNQSGKRGRQDIVLKDIEARIQRISQLPDGSRAANYFNIALRDRMDAYGEAAQEQVKKLCVDPQNM